MKQSDMDVANMPRIEAQGHYFRTQIFNWDTL